MPIGLDDGLSPDDVGVDTPLAGSPLDDLVSRPGEVAVDPAEEGVGPSEVLLHAAGGVELGIVGTGLGGRPHQRRARGVTRQRRSGA